MTREEELKMLNAELSDNQEEAWDIIRDRLIDSGWLLVRSNPSGETFRKQLDRDTDIDITFNRYWVCVSIVGSSAIQVCSRATEVKILW